MNDNINRRSWTHQEINILRENYPNELIPWVEILQKLPGRSLASCRLMADRLQLKRPRKLNDYEQIRRSERWKELEEEIMKAHPELSKSKEGNRLIHLQVLDRIVRERNPNLSEEEYSDLIAKLTSKSKVWIEILEEQKQREEEYAKNPIGRKLLKFEKTGVIDID